MTAVIWPDGGPPAPGQLKPDLATLYRDLSLDEAAGLAQRAVAVLESTRDEWQRLRATEVLTAITCFVPAPLGHVHKRLLADTVFVDPDMPVWAQLDAVVFRDGDAAVRDRLLAIASETVPGEFDDPSSWRHGLALTGSAWIGDEAVQAAFWAGKLNGDPLWAAHHAGWDLTPDGTRRDLCGPICCALLPVRGPLDPRAPVRTAYPFDSTCPSCGRGLTVLFNLDLAGGALWFLGLPGERLRVVTCLNCVAYGVTVSEVDFAGNVRSFEPRGRGTDDAVDPAPPRAVALGDPEPTPFAAAFREQDPGSHLGGHPHWVQNPSYPRHAACGAALRFLGQVDLGMGGLRGPNAVAGVVYAFLDQPCGMVACSYQQD